MSGGPLGKTGVCRRAADAGLPARHAAARFGIGVATAIVWGSVSGRTGWRAEAAANLTRSIGAAVPCSPETVDGSLPCPAVSVPPEPSFGPLRPPQAPGRPPPLVRQLRNPSRRLLTIRTSAPEAWPVSPAGFLPQTLPLPRISGAASAQNNLVPKSYAFSVDSSPGAMRTSACLRRMFSPI